jgi:putative ABC transport system substrate-binding protein
VRRREFITLLGGAAAWPIAARGQGERVRRVGVLMNYAATQPEGQSYLSAFIQGLTQLGWKEGQNLRVDVRWNAGDAALARTYAAQLIGLMPDVILASSTTNLTIIRQATSTVPIVFVQVSDPVAQGFVANLAHPGGNLTGFTAYEFSIGAKWLDMLKEVVSGLTQVAVMFHPETSPQSKFFMQAIDAAAPSLGVKAVAMPVRTPDDIEPALERLARQPNSGLILSTDSFISSRFSLIADLAASYRVPSISNAPSFAKDGGLIAYGTNYELPNQFRQAGGYVDRILKGANPAEMPVQQPDKYTLVINLRTAKALGLTVPLPLLGRADEVIE